MGELHSISAPPQKMRQHLHSSLLFSSLLWTAFRPHCGRTVCAQFLGSGASRFSRYAFQTLVPLGIHRLSLTSPPRPSPSPVRESQSPHPAIPECNLPAARNRYAHRTDTMRTKRRQVSEIGPLSMRLQCGRSEDHSAGFSLLLSSLQPYKQLFDFSVKRQKDPPAASPSSDFSRPRICRAAPPARPSSHRGMVGKSPG